MTWQRPYGDMVVDDVAVSDLHIWANGVSTHGSFWFVVWCHVAQSWAATWHHCIGCLFKILWSPPDSNPGPPPTVQRFGNGCPTGAPFYVP